MSLTRWKVPTLVLAVASGLVLVAATMAVAHPDPFPLRLADNSTHDYCSSETTATEEATFENQVENSIQHLGGATQMTTLPRSSCSPSIDFYWYVTPASSFDDPDVYAGTLCVDPISATRCDRFRVRFNARFMGRTGLQRRHTACHEISRTLGTDDSLMLANGCFPQTAFSDGITHTTHEVDHINDFY